MRRWTLSEARAELANVRAVIDAAREVTARIAQPSPPSSNGRGPSPNQEDTQAELADLLGELGDQGIVVRNLEPGLVDFHAVAPSGREYWLCWVYGEPELAWWHWVEDGFAGRTPVDQPPEGVPFV
jgi:arsenite methyltransferase